ncbi:MAG TPA: hypothetical protein VEF34_14005 [Syntrophobacteraceae bacterium]|nr:hypothetical protein [Syntrophobacteraceae bacterium]
MEGKQCEIETKVFAPGAEVCDEALCYICKDGVWEQESTLELDAKSWYSEGSKQ